MASEQTRTRVTLGLRLLGCSACIVLGCASKPAGTGLPGDDKVLAEVNHTTITQYDVERTALEAFGPDAVRGLSDETKKKLLDSLVQSRAIAQVREKELDASEQAAVAKQVSAFREQLLVKQYLSKHAPWGEISDDAVHEYYESHQQRFGAKKVRSYEAVTSTSELSPSQRASVFAALGDAAKQTDWAAWAGKLGAAGQPLALRRGDDDAALLDPKLRQLIASLEVGKTSPLTLLDGRPYVVRVTAQRELPARPLAEVKDEIRKTLAPTQIRDAVKQASDHVLKSAEVAYR